MEQYRVGLDDQQFPRRAVVWAPRAATASAVGDGAHSAVAAPTAGEIMDRGGWPTVAFPAPVRPTRVAAPTAAQVVAGAAVAELDLPARRPLPPRRAATWRPVGVAVAAASTLIVGVAATVGGGGESARRAVLTAHPRLEAAPWVTPAPAPPPAAPPTTLAPAPAPAPAPPPPPPPAPAPAPAPPSGGVPAPIPAPTGASLAAVGNKVHKVLSGPHGTDISYPQCERDLPVDRHFAIVGVTGGRPFKPNPCLAKQWQWAVAHGAASVYLNVANGQPLDETHSYIYGMQTIDYALDYAASQGVGDLPFVWLDVETLNSWNKTNLRVNAQVIRGAIDRLHQRGVGAGVYSTAYQWGRIAGDYRPGVPVWYATGANDGARAPEKCDARWSFTGGPVYLVQYVFGNLDRNVTCAAVVPNSARAFKMK